MQYGITAGATIAVTSANKTLLRVAATSAVGCQICEIGVFFDGTTAGAPILVTLQTDGGISGGTAGTAPTVTQSRGVTATATVTTTGSYSAEPTYTSAAVWKTMWVPNTSGLLLQLPLGREYEVTPGTHGFALLVSSTASTPNARAYMEVVQGPS